MADLSALQSHKPQTKKKKTKPAYFNNTKNLQYKLRSFNLKCFFFTEKCKNLKNRIVCSGTLTRSCKRPWWERGDIHQWDADLYWGVQSLQLLAERYRVAGPTAGRGTVREDSHRNRPTGACLTLLSPCPSKGITFQ